MLHSSTSSVVPNTPDTNSGILAQAANLTRALRARKRRLREIGRRFNAYQKNALPMPEALRVQETDGRLFRTRLSGEFYNGLVPRAIVEQHERGYQECLGRRDGVEWVVNEAARARGTEIIEAHKRWADEEYRHLVAIGAEWPDGEADRVSGEIAEMIERLSRTAATVIGEFTAKARLVKLIGVSPQTESLLRSIVRDLASLEAVDCHETAALQH